ncbi:hypothetical protein ROHU_011579 [Labeo rohita]|uniref:Reverse transcriptase domain-containing protein n=2 Tax=Labeo rohita TaxID=84645 RepID=A0A498LSB2_LABRO|nr:hypothetical protein ROHU_011579 [Labeo rohita]
MNLLITAAGKESRGPIMESGTRQPPIRGFMDDLTITTSSHVQARWILKALDEVAAWARMKFKPRKSRSMVIRNRKVTSKFQLELQGEVIPSIEENPIKCLGKWYDASLTDISNVSRTEKQADEWLRKIEGSGLPGKFKAWLFQHGLLPRLMWLLTIYEVPLTSVEGAERQVNKHLLRWLGIPPSFTSVGLYIRSADTMLRHLSDSSVSVDRPSEQCCGGSVSRRSSDRVILLGTAHSGTDAKRPETTPSESVSISHMFQKKVLSLLVDIRHRLKETQPASSAVHIERMDTMEDFELQEQSLSDAQAFDTLVMRCDCLKAGEADCSDAISISPSSPREKWLRRRTHVKLRRKLYWKQTFPAVARNMRGNRQVKRSKTNSLAKRLVVRLSGRPLPPQTTAVRNAAVDLVPHWKGVVPSSLGSGTALLLASRLAPGPPSLPRKE